MRTVCDVKGNQGPDLGISPFKIDDAARLEVDFCPGMWWLLAGPHDGHMRTPATYAYGELKSVMERRQLEFFIAVVEHRGFTRAANALHVSQPALSRSIRLLENELESKLFRRNPSGIVITPAAESLMRRARAILHDMEAFRAAARSTPGKLVGTVEVALSSAPAIEPMTAIVAELQRVHPEVLTVGLGCNSSQNALDLVTSGRCDLALFGQPEIPAASDILFHRVHKEELMLALPPGSSLSLLEHISPGDLQNQSFIVAPPNTTMRQLFENLSFQAGNLRVAAVASHREALLPMVLKGIGLSFLPAGWKSLVESAGGSLRSLDPPVSVPIWLAQRTRVDAASQAFVKVALKLAR